MSVDGIIFSKVANYDFMKDRRRKTYDHYLTCIAKSSVEAVTFEESVEKFSQKLEPVCELLSFAQNRDVFYWGFKSPTKGSVPQQMFHSIRTGVAKSTPVVNEWCTGKFLTVSLPLLRDKQYCKDTGIDRALSWYWETEFFRGPQAVQVLFPSYWIVLEILANAHASSGAYDEIVEKKVAKRLKREFTRLVRELSADTDKKERLLQNVIGVNNELIGYKVQRLLTTYGLGQYNSEIETFYKFRNDIIHGRRFERESYNPIDCRRKIERLAEKLLLKVLKFYKEDCVHSAYMRDSLTAPQ